MPLYWIEYPPLTITRLNSHLSARTGFLRQPLPGIPLPEPSDLDRPCRGACLSWAARGGSVVLSLVWEEDGKLILRAWP